MSEQQTVSVWIWDRTLPAAQFNIRRELSALVSAKFAKRVWAQRSGQFLIAVVSPEAPVAECGYVKNLDHLCERMAAAIPAALSKRCGVELKLRVSPEAEQWLEWIVQGHKDIAAMGRKRTPSVEGIATAR